MFHCSCSNILQLVTSYDMCYFSKLVEFLAGLFIYVLLDAGLASGYKSDMPAH